MTADPMLPIDPYHEPWPDEIGAFWAYREPATGVDDRRHERGDE